MLVRRYMCYKSFRRHTLVSEGGSVSDTVCAYHMKIVRIFASCCFSHGRLFSVSFSVLCMGNTIIKNNIRNN